VTNKDKNREFREAVRQTERKIGRQLSASEKRRFHDEVSGADYTLEEMVEIGKAMFR
jgi:hypothetical protein